MIDDAKILENKKEILGLLKSVKREGMDKLVEFLESPECDFFRAPASTQYHLHIRGGLAQHSLNVYHTFVRLIDLFNFKIDRDSVIVTALLHDFCKINLYKNNLLKSGKLSESKPYTTQDLFPAGHGEKSVIQIQNWIDLTESECLMIRWHYGTFDRAFNQYADRIFKLCPEAFLFFQADWMASLYVDDREDEQTWQHSTPIMNDKG